MITTYRDKSDIYTDKDLTGCFSRGGWVLYCLDVQYMVFAQYIRKKKKRTIVTNTVCNVMCLSGNISKLVLWQRFCCVLILSVSSLVRMSY